MNNDPTRPPPALLGPTGQVFRRPGGGYSTELNITMDAPGGWVNVPLLVPGQTDVEKLLTGARPTREQMQQALRYMLTHTSIPRYETEDEALAAEQARHDRLERWLDPYRERGR